MKIYQIKSMLSAFLFFIFASSLFLLGGCTEKARETDSLHSSSSSSLASEAIEVQVAALKGPTSMGMVKLMEDSKNHKTGQNNYRFSVVGSVDGVVVDIAQNKVDIAALPANLGSVLFQNTKESIEVLAINTLGVLYMVEQGEEVQTVADLKGKTIYASGKGATPEFVLNYILAQNNLNPQIDVQIEYKAEHTECLTALMNDPNGIALLPQPFVSTAQIKDNTIRIALDLNQEWETLQKDQTNPSALITGIVVARKDFIQKNPEAVALFLEQYQASVEYVQKDIPGAAKLIDSFDIVPEAVALKALPYSNIVFIQGQEMKDMLEGYYQILFDANPQSVGGKLPNENFYYGIKN